MPGTLTYNGQDFSHDDFISHLNGGGLDELVSNNPNIHDYAENLRGNPAQDGGQKKVEPAPVVGQAGSEPVNPTDAQVKAWTLDYINSPMYKKRLANTWVHPDLIQIARDKKIAGTTFTETQNAPSDLPAGMATTYTDNAFLPNQLNISDNQLKDENISRTEAAAHELGHAINGNPNSPLLRLNPVEEHYILSRNKNVTNDQLTSFFKDAPGGTVSHDLSNDSSTHDIAPNESMSDIQALRYLLHQKGIYDARTQDLTPELLKKAANDPDIKNSFIWKRLHQNFDDKAIMDINNMIAFGGPSDSAENTA